MAWQSIVALISLAGCIEQGYFLDPVPPRLRNLAPVPDPTYLDRFVQVVVPQVDVLWVIDNSCSMQDEQDQLSASFPDFIGYFLESGLDYHVGVTSTDLDAVYNGSNGKLVVVDGDVTFIDQSTPSPEDTFAAMASLGTAGSGAEKGIGATYMALEVQRETQNEGFYRDEAAVHTVVITDEPDYSSIVTEREFVDWYRGLKHEPEERTFSCIVNPYTGGQYESASIQIGGLQLSENEADWASLLDQLGLLASGYQREFFLSHIPVDGAIQVVVDVEGTLSFFDDGDWTYSQTRNSVSFHSYVPPAAAIVYIEYELAASQAEE